jgi:hypothetical protein
MEPWVPIYTPRITGAWWTPVHGNGVEEATSRPLYARKCPGRRGEVLGSLMLSGSREPGSGRLVKKLNQSTPTRPARTRSVDNVTKQNTREDKKGRSTFIHDEPEDYIAGEPGSRKRKIQGRS